MNGVDDARLMMAPKKRPRAWAGKRTFSPEQWLKRDLRGASTVSAKAMKSGKRPITLAKVTLTEPRDV